MDERLYELTNVISSDKFIALNGAEQIRMSRQSALMYQYSEVLGERIAACLPDCKEGQ